VNPYTLGRVVFDCHDAGAIHLRCRWCGARERFLGTPTDAPEYWPDKVSAAGVVAWIIEHVKACPRKALPACPVCYGTGMVEADPPSCTCGTSQPGYPHERYCGAEPCPRGCPVQAEETHA
jgi:hypothetical protein